MSNGIKNYEIGSDFYSIPTILKEKIKNRARIQEKENKKFLFLGRQAISYCLKDLENNINGNIALLPEYTCQTVIQPFLENGYSVKYYETDKDLMIRVSKINDYIKKYNASIVLLQPMFGFNTIILDEEILPVNVILDSTQNYFTESNIDFQNYTITSLRKWLGIADGALVIKNKGIFKHIKTKNVNKEFIEMSKEAFSLKYEYLYFDKAEKSEFQDKYFELKEFILNTKEILNMSSFSKEILLREDFKKLKDKRIENYKELLLFENWDEIGEVIFSEVFEGVCPLYFPIYTTKVNRKEIQDYLVKEKIYCPIIWPIPDALKNNTLSEISKFIYDNILVIPIDQRYNIKDMQYIKEKLQEFISITKERKI